MKEYIVPIADNERDYDEMFIGTIRKREMLVRCGECKYRYVDGDNVRYNLCLLNHNKVQSDEWYCADGERRADDE